MSESNACLLWFASALLALLTSAARAQSVSSLDEVVITAKSLEEELPQQLAQYGTHLDTITAAQVKDGGYIDVSSALQALAPGLYVSSKSGPFDYVNVSLQGSRTPDVLWLVDGIRINNRLYAGTTPLDTLPSSMVERIEVLDGGQSLFYGTQAVAGAVNIVTKAFADRPDGSASAGADTNQGVHVNGFFRDGIGDHRFVVYASHDESSGIHPYPVEEFQPSSTDRYRYYHVTTAGAKYGYHPAGPLDLGVAFQHTSATLDYGQPMLTATAFNERNEELFSARLDYRPSDALSLYLKGYGHWWLSHYTEFDNVLGSPGALETIDHHDFWGYRDYGVNLLAKVGVNRGLEYLAGYDFQNYSGRDAVLVIRQQTEHTNALFAQIRSTPELIANAHLAFGVRYNSPNVGESSTVWNASGQYDLSRSLFLKASVGTAFRLPTAEELFANDPEDERGNSNLKPETSTYANVSIGGVLEVGGPRVRWEFIGFERRVSNLIDYASFDSTTNQDVFGNVPGKVTTHGMEGVLDISFTPAWSVNVDGTYSRTRQEGSDRQFPRIPESQLKAGLDYHPAALPIGISAALVHVGNLDAEPLGPGGGRFGYGNYTTLDLSGRVFLTESRRHRIDAHLSNVFGRTYDTNLGFGVADSSGDAYVVHDRGVPRTFSIYYTYSL